jgi:enterochelin esterase family protein
MALRTALERPEAVGCALAQSPSLWQRELVMPEAGTSRLPKVYLEVGSQEWVLRDPARRLAAALQHAGAPIRFFEFNGGHDYACWRGGIADGLRALLPPTTGRGLHEAAVS